MSFDPLDFEEEEEPKVTVPLEDPRFPDGKIEIVLQRVGEVGVASVEDYIAKMVQQYVTGDPDEGTAPETLVVKGKAYRLNRPLIRNIAYILVMQRQEPVYPFGFYLGLAKNFSSQYARLRREAWKLQEPARPKSGEERLNPFDDLEDAFEAGSSAVLLISDNGTPASKPGKRTASSALPIP